MFELIRANKIKSAFLIGALAAVLVLLGYVVGAVSLPGGGVVGVVVAAVLVLVLSLVAYFQGDSIMLAMSGARQIEHKDHPQLFNVVEEMSIAAGLPVPKVYIIDDTALNAFATGRSPKTASVAITKGLLMKLNRDELQGVVAHEMSHVLNRDILYMTLAGILVGSVVLLADFYLRSMWYGGFARRRRRSSRDDGGAQAILVVVGIVAAILAPLLARLLYLACSRRREYLADASAARLTRYPEGLASALEKLSRDREILEVANRATAPMYIVHPVKALEARASSLMSTHPPTGERIAILRAMGHGASVADYQKAYNKYHAGHSLVPATSLREAEPLAARGPSEEAARKETPRHRLERAHVALDAVRRVAGFSFIHCACGAVLKIPPSYPRPRIFCPRCNTTHNTAEAQPAQAQSA